MDPSTVYRIQLRVGLVFGAGALSYGVVAAMSLVFEFDTPVRSALCSSAIILPLLFGIGGLVSSARNTTAVRVFQSCLLFASGVAYIVLNEPDDLGGVGLIVLSLVVTLQYGFLRTRFVLKMAACLAVVVAATSYAAITHGRALHFAVVPPILFTAACLYLMWLAFAEELSEYRAITQRLHAEAQADRVFVELGKRLAGLVHNLRAKLSAIDGYNELLSSESELTRPSIREPLALQKLAIDETLASIDDLLATVRSYRRSESGGFPLSQTIHACLDAALALARFRSEPEVRLELSQDDMIGGVPSTVSQILDSLIRNACDSMASLPQAALRIRTSADPAGITCMITDIGPGIPFCRFCRVPDCMWCDEFQIGRSTKPGGNGIGIVHARELLRRVGGWLRYSTGAASGTSVFVWFPRDTD